MPKKKRRSVNLGQPTKQDFNFLAKVLCEHGANSDDLVGRLAAHFKRRNPRFDSDRFIRATQTCPARR